MAFRFGLAKSFASPVGAGQVRFSLRLLERQKPSWRLLLRALRGLLTRRHREFQSEEKTGAAMGLRICWVATGALIGLVLK